MSNNETDRLIVDEKTFTKGTIQDEPVQLGPLPSLKIMYLTVFLQSITFTIVLPSLWFYLESLGADKQFLGITVAIYSVGQFFGSLIFGAWSNNRPTLEPLIVSLIVSVLGNVYYGLAQDVPESKWQVFVARFFVGFAAGNISLCRAFVSEASTIEKKTANMSACGAAQGIGFVVGPCLGFALGYFPRVKVGPVVIDEYTSAGFLSGTFALLNIILLPFTFTDVPSKTQTGKPYVPPMTRSEYLPMIITMFEFFVVISVFSVFETVCAPLTQYYYNWHTKLNGVLLLGAGAISVATFIGLGICTKSKKKMDDRKLLMIGFVLLIISMFILTPYPFEKTLPIWQLVLAAFFLSVGYPVASALVFSLFAKVINPLGQGTKMGYLTAVGSLARMLGPIWATAALPLGTNEGQVLFLVTGGLVSIALIVVFIFYRVLVPHGDYEPTVGGDDPNGVASSVHSFTSTASSITTPNAEDPKSGQLTF